MLLDKVLEDGGLHSTENGITLRIRLPWYRSLPLSTVEITSLAIDDQPVPAKNIRFSLEQDEWALNELPTLIDRYWFVLDSAELHIAAPRLTDVTHRVAIQVALYPPYVRGLKRIFTCTKMMMRGE